MDVMSAQGLFSFVLFVYFSRLTVLYVYTRNNQSDRVVKVIEKVLL